MSAAGCGGVTAADTRPRAKGAVQPERGEQGGAASRAQSRGAEWCVCVDVEFVVVWFDVV